MSERKPISGGPRRLGGTLMSRRSFSAGLAGVAIAGSCGPALPVAAESGTFSETLDEAVAGGELPGYVALVDRGGDVVVRTRGVQDLETGKSIRRDTIFAVASIAKPITAVSALILVEDGVLGLDDPVDEWLPELADRRVIRSLDADLDDTVPAERPITLRDLLTLRMGLGAVFADPSGSPLLQRMAALEVAPGPKLFGHSADEYMARLGELPLVHQPGARWLYHTGLDVAGVLVARASGMSLGEFQRERIFAPLGMTDTGFYVPNEDADRLATCYWRDAESGEFDVWIPASGESFREPPPFESGGGGHVSTVDDFLAFGRMLLNGGEYLGRRIISEPAIAEMLTDQIPPEQKAASDFFPGFWETHGWGLGTAIVTEPDDIAPEPGRFGWWGGFGTTFFADPNADTVALLFTQRMMNSADDTAMGETFLRNALHTDTGGSQ